eukprot:CAMPEP_0119122542 /NCGR_PEP_ID=MMETSP1310-20130426/2774_1 /TAXON_ID=464262 /ORGANISM="Genus nov. species nov., Strain RCC2339" /LENGTH=87 /DNA_ID=CAMNT_0007112217 /DNA_START=16 /DNA_END=279 /DNA_ORIENTATION=+
MRPDMSEDEVVAEADEFKAFIEEHGAEDVVVSIKGRQRMASPIQGEWNGVYVLLMYVAPTKVGKLVQDRLSAPDDAKRIMRFLNTRP